MRRGRAGPTHQMGRPGITGCAQSCAARAGVFAANKCAQSWKGDHSMYDDATFVACSGIFAFWIICGLLAGYLYGKRGRSQLVGCLGGFVLGPLGIVLALVTPADRTALARKERELEAEKLRRGELKQCSYCGELVRPVAVVCRFCGREIVPPTQ